MLKQKQHINDVYCTIYISDDDIMHDDEARCDGSMDPGDPTVVYVSIHLIWRYAAATRVLF